MDKRRKITTILLVAVALQHTYLAHHKRCESRVLC